LSRARADRIDLLLRKSRFGITEALKHSPASKAGRLLILVDQFEEIFRFADLRTQRAKTAVRQQEERDEATLFIQLLLATREDPDFDGQIIITMRSDFIGDCARFHGLAEAVTATQYLVPSLTRDQLARAIRGPVERAGSEVDPALVQRLLNDTEEDPDQLPVMQHVLMRCWRHAARLVVPPGEQYSDTASWQEAEGVRVSEADYAAVGRAAGALSQHANEVIANLRKDRLPELSSIGLDLEMAVKRIFQCLTDTDSRGRVTRRPQTLGSIVDVIAPDDIQPKQRDAVREDVASVIGRFASPECSFLRTPDRGDSEEESVIDIGHEALIRRWDKLGSPGEKNWVREEQHDAEEFSNLLRVARIGSLISKDKLPEFESWWDKRRPTTAWARRYSRDAPAELRTARDVLIRSRSHLRFKRVVLVSAACLAILAILGALAWSAWTAEGRLDAAIQAKQRYLSILGRYQLLHSRASTGLITALYGFCDARSESAQSWGGRLLRGIRPSPGATPELRALAYSALEELGERRVLTLSAKPDEQVNVAVAYAGHQVLIAAPGLLFSWVNGKDRSSDRVQKVADLFSLKNSGGANNSAVPMDLVVSPDQKEALVSTMLQQRLLMVDLTNGKVHELGKAKDPAVGNGVFSRDGTYIATFAWFGARPRLWRRIKGAYKEDLKALKGVPPDIISATFDSRSEKLLLGSKSGRTFIVSLDGKTPPVQWTAGEKDDASGLISAIAFQPTNRNLFLKVQGQQAYLCYVKETDRNEPADRKSDNGRKKCYPLQAESAVFRGSFSPDGRHVALISPDGTLRIYRAPSPDGRPLVSEKPEQITRFGPSAFSFAWNPNSPHELAVASQGGELDRRGRVTKGAIWIWDVDTALSKDLGTSSDGGPTPGRFTCPHGNANVVIKCDPRDASDPVKIGFRGRDLGPLAFYDRTTGAQSADVSGNWLAWALNEGGILLFRFPSPRPVAVIGQGTKWRYVRFSDQPREPQRAIAVDTEGNQRSWRYFATAEELESFSKSKLPTETEMNLDELRRSGSLRLERTALTLNATESRNLRGIVEWITPPELRGRNGCLQEVEQTPAR
jgi:hypothetical protein